MNFTIYNLGCKVNAYEAEAVAEEMTEAGWKRVDGDESTDAVIIFTCAVTNIAASKSRKTLHQTIRRHPGAVTVVAGCYAQVNDGLLDDADIVVGTADRHLIPSYIDQFQQDHKKINAVKNLRGESFELLKADHLENHSRGVLKIQDGCNQFCSFCIIPYARGRERSLDPDTVIKQAEKIASHHSEIVLTGIHTGRYGREYNISLAEMMERILHEVPSVQRLRLSSIEITEVTDELLALMKNEKRIARHLHIPLQAGNDDVLKAMRRPYTTKMYYDRIEEIRKNIPDIAISCDIMTGFPGESSQQFQDGFSFLEKCAFSFLHVFPFSSREGTLASRMPGQVSPEVKKERTSACLQLSKQLQQKYDSSWIGKQVELIAERGENGDTPGYTSQYVRGIIKNKTIQRGTLVKGRAASYHNGALEIEENDE